MMKNLVCKKFNLLDITIKKLYDKINVLDKEVHRLKNERKVVKSGIREIKDLCCDVLNGSNEIKSNFDHIDIIQSNKITRADQICQTDSVCSIIDKHTQTEKNKIFNNLPKVLEKPTVEVNEVINVSNNNLIRHNELWTEVVSKKNKRQGQGFKINNSKQKLTISENKFKNYALLLKFPQNFDNVWVVKNIKNLIKINKLAESIVSSRNCKNGDYLLEVKKDGNLLKISDLVEKHFGNVCKIQPKCNLINLSITGFDDFCSEKEILNDLHKLSPSGNIDYIKLTRVGQLKYRGNFANILVDGNFGKFLINLNKIKIGFNDCKIKEWLKPIQCHFCRCYGHVKSRCDSLILENLRGGQDLNVSCSFNNNPWVLSQICNTDLWQISI